MITKKTELKTYRIDYLCDDCKVPVHSVYGSTNAIGTKFHHVCPKCKKQYDFGYDIRYPHFQYEDLNHSVL